jgi:hypothetical protein
MWSAVSRCSDEGQVRQLREPFPLQVEHSAEHATHVGACVAPYRPYRARERYVVNVETCKNIVRFNRHIESGSVSPDLPPQLNCPNVVLGRVTMGPNLQLRSMVARAVA